MESVWVLTEEFNDYDQHGAYFVAVFPNKPTREQLHNHVGDIAYVDLLLTKGGGRIKNDYQWWNLSEYTF